MDAELERAAQLPLYRKHVAWLRCFRGSDTTVAMIFVAELHGIERFDSPRALAAYLGLVPSLYGTKGETRDLTLRQGTPSSRSEYALLPTKNDHAALRRSRRNPRMAV